MIRLLSRFALCGSLFLVACSKQEPAEKKVAPARSAEKAAAEVEVATNDGFAPFVQRLEKLKEAGRQSGETLLTGTQLVFDYAQRLVQMSGNVLVIDERGELAADTLSGRFSTSNGVESIDFVQLDGRASATDGINRLSGERITAWLGDERKVVCEPNVLLEVSGVAGGEGISEIRADRMVYAEKDRMVELDGRVRLRDPRGAMNCSRARIFLKDDNKIDWLEALSEVIIQTEDRKALAGRAAYHADEGKFTLEDGPKVKQGQHIMTGDRITVWNETRRMVCEPNARVLLHIDEATRAKFLKDLND